MSEEAVIMKPPLLGKMLKQAETLIARKAVMVCSFYGHKTEPLPLHTPMSKRTVTARAASGLKLAVGEWCHENAEDSTPASDLAEAVSGHRDFLKKSALGVAETKRTISRIGSLQLGKVLVPTGYPEGIQNLLDLHGSSI